MNRYEFISFVRANNSADGALRAPCVSHAVAGELLGQAFKTFTAIQQHGHAVVHRYVTIYYSMLVLHARCMAYGLSPALYSLINVPSSVLLITIHALYVYGRTAMGPCFAYEVHDGLLECARPSALGL